MSIRLDLRIETDLRGLEQTALLLQTPMLLNAFLNIASARSWLAPTLGVMRLHAYLVQALVPGKATPPQAQLPGFDGAVSTSEKQDLAAFVRDLQENGDERAVEASKALENWGALEVVDMGFKGTYDTLLVMRNVNTVSK